MSSKAGIKRKRDTPKARSTTSKAQKSRNAMVRVPKNRLNFPNGMKTTLRYTERIEFTPTSTSVQQIKFRGNDCYDPFVTFGGHQPRGFDQFMDAYDKFTVLQSQCTVQFMYEGYDGPSLKTAAGNLTQNRSSTDNVPALTPVACGLHKGTEGLSAGSYIEQMEKDRTQWGYITGSGGQVLTLTGKGSTREMTGKQYSIGAEGYYGTASASPEQEWFWEVWAGRVSDDYPQEQVKVVANVILMLDVVFHEPKTLVAS